MVLFLIVMGNILIIYQKERADARPKRRKLEIFLIGWNLTVELVKIWVETINYGLKIGDFSAGWTY